MSGQWVALYPMSPRRAAILAILVTITAHASLSGAPIAVRVSGTRFVGADTSTFSWRGITAFRLIEQVASGREADAERYLAWCAAHDITVVRVLAMAKQAFALPPDRGATALPRLLAMARAHGIQVEVVALADTASYTVDYDAHVSKIGQICAAAGNCFIELANEPYHPTQADALHDRAFLRRLRARIPPEIPVALGAAQSPQDSGGGDYATVHLSRDTGVGGWGHVFALPAARDLIARLKVPVVSDEPIGAAPRLEAGRRDSEPARFQAAALLTRMMGLAATFHYSSGIQAAIPAGRELACFEAWREAWRLLPADIETTGRFDADRLTVVPPPEAGTPSHAWQVVRGTDAWVLIAGEEAVPAPSQRPGWKIHGVRRWSGLALWHFVSSAPGDITGPSPGP
jgi:hypothetical protein